MPPVIVPAVTPGLTVTTIVAVAVPQAPLTVYDIVATPLAIPNTTPDPSTETLLAAVLHTPPATASVSVVVPPGHNCVIPEIAPAETEPELTVTTMVALPEPQLPVVVYDIIDVPAATPVTVPDELTVATPGELELHIPPLTTSLKIVVPPIHVAAVPVIVPAVAPTVTASVAEHDEDP